MNCCTDIRQDDYVYRRTVEGCSPDCGKAYLAEQICCDQIQQLAYCGTLSFPEWPDCCSMPCKLERIIATSIRANHCRAHVHSLSLNLRCFLIDGCSRRITVDTFIDVPLSNCPFRVKQGEILRLGAAVHAKRFACFVPGKAFAEIEIRLRQVITAALSACIFTERGNACACRRLPLYPQPQKASGDRNKVVKSLDSCGYLE